MKTNAEYLKLKQGQLEDAGKVAKRAGTFLAKVQSDIEEPHRSAAFTPSR